MNFQCQFAILDNPLYRLACIYCSGTDVHAYLHSNRKCRSNLKGWKIQQLIAVWQILSLLRFSRGWLSLHWPLHLKLEISSIVNTIQYIWTKYNKNIFIIFSIVQKSTHFTFLSNKNHQTCLQKVQIGGNTQILAKCVTHSSRRTTRLYDLGSQFQYIRWQHCCVQTDQGARITYLLSGPDILLPYQTWNCHLLVVCMDCGYILK